MVFDSVPVGLVNVPLEALAARLPKVIAKSPPATRERTSDRLPFSLPAGKNVD